MLAYGFLDFKGCVFCVRFSHTDPIELSTQTLEDNVRDSLKTGHITTSEADIALSTLKREFPRGIKAVGADALRYGLCSYDAKSK